MLGAVAVAGVVAKKKIAEYEAIEEEYAAREARRRR